jgi:VanZ family protein
VSRFLPPVLWMAAIAVFSSELFGADRTGGYVLALLTRLLPWAGTETLHALHGLIRKLGHVVEYGILATLWLRALAPGGATGRASARAAWWAVGLSAAYAGVDELRQGLAPNRSPSASDVLIDTAGAALAVVALRAPAAPARGLRRLARATAVALAGLSLAAAGVDWTLGLPAWDLLLGAAGLAGLALALRPRPGV